MKQRSGKISYSSLLFISILALCGMFSTHCKKIDVERMVLLKTNGVTGISYASATVNGTLIDLGENKLEQHGFQWAKAGQSVMPGNTISLGATTQTGEVTGILQDLEPGTEYEVWTYAKNGEMEYSAEPLEFTTLAATVPVVETRIFTIGETTIEFGGFISSTGGSAITEKGVVIGEAGNESPTVENGVRKRIDTGTDLYSTEIGGFTHYTVYYIRAYAVNDVDVAYGEPIPLRTLCSCGEFLEDPRDLQLYPTIQIGDQCWMQENLNVGNEVPIEDGQSNNQVIEKFCYDDNEDNCDLYGGLYTWDEMMQYSLEPAQGVCPEGWHIPTDEDWKKMELFLGIPEEDLDYLNQRGDDEGGMLKLADVPPWDAPNALASNSTHFSAWPAGMIFPESGTSTGMGALTVFWTSSLASDEYAIYRMLESGHGGIDRWEGNRANTSSVRCLRD